MANQSPHFPDCFYRVSIKGAYVKDGKIMLCKEVENGVTKWVLPGGGMDFGERHDEALKREVKEEMGLKVTWVDKHPVYSWVSRFDNRPNVEWFYGLVLLYRFNVEDLEITPSPECLEIKFFTPQELARLDTNSPHTESLKEIFDIADFSS